MREGCFRLDCATSSLVIAVRPGRTPDLLYIGEKLSDGFDLTSLEPALGRGPRESTPEGGVLMGLAAFEGWDLLGAASMRGRATDGPWPTSFAFERVEAGAAGLSFHWRSENAHLALSLMIDAVGGLFVWRARLVNEGAAAFELDWLAALATPLPDWASVAWLYSGRWGGEFNLAARDIGLGAIVKESRGGRPGFDGAGYAIVGERGADDQRGRLLGAHLAWSGDQRMMIERVGAGPAQLQLGEPLAPREVVLAPGASYETPRALLAFTDRGLNGLRAIFHAHVRAAAPLREGPRKVHFNSWEAVYFDFDAGRLMRLAEEAAALGVERFVLDDGWFEGRGSDRAGLGDWRPDHARFPEGLGPLIAHVDALGMDFGLWVEPEMVNPDSALYRAHPDWALHNPGADRPTQRHQLVLDLTNPAPAAHILAALDALLSAYPIAYLKWDHNRDLRPASSAGAPAGHAQTLAYYDLLDRLRARHPRVEIESCASGGGRIDLEVLTRATRVWLSDNTDAIERLAMQTAASIFLPPETMGSHVGSSPNPSTGRRLSMTLRARVALFAHMGVEADPARMSAREKATLVSQIALYKRHRDLIARGNFYSFPGPAAPYAWMSVAPDRREALALLARPDLARHAETPPVTLPYLAPDMRYRVRLEEPWPGAAARGLADAAFWRAGPLLTGEALARVGMRLPLIHPETAWLVHLAAED